MTAVRKAVVIGVGSEYRRDDAAALEVLRRLAGRVPAGTQLLESDGEPASLVQAWDGAGLAVVVDAAALPAVPAGRLHRVDVTAGLGPAVVPEPARASWHNAGLGTAIALGGALGRLPERLIVHWVQVADTGYGQQLSPAVAASVDALVEAVLADLADLMGQPG